MTAHLRANHPVDAPVVCDLCERRLLAVELEGHQCFSSGDHQTSESQQQQQQTQEHRCCWLDCQQTFASASELFSHAQAHVSSCTGLSPSGQAALLGGYFRKFRCTHAHCRPQPYITENRSHLVRHIRTLHFGY